jgi:hypothetical protein
MKLVAAFSSFAKTPKTYKRCSLRIKVWDPQEAGKANKNVFD